MQKTTEQLRFFARPGREDLEPLEMGGVLDVALELLAPNLEAAKVGVKRSGMGAVVWGNRLRLEQAVTNVLRNAVDAMSEDGGDLSVALSVVGGDAVIAVRDEGPGLAGVAIEELQEPFFTTRASGEGMGLGLAISSEIVKEHGGEIVARDLAEGGAEFVISLPIYDGEDQG
jgi:two-component system C4-dicarboxylate transport sensor histidine kinase DctB